MFVNLRNLFFLEIPQVYEHFLSFITHSSLLYITKITTFKKHSLAYPV